MLSQGTSATTLESTVIQDYNSRLAAAVASFEAANDGVRYSLVLFSSLEPVFMFICVYAGEDLAVGLAQRVRDDPEQPYAIRLP